MTKATKPDISYGTGVPSISTSGEFYKDLDTDILYQKLKSGAWEVKPTQPNGDVKIDPAAGNAAVATSSGGAVTVSVSGKQVEFGTQAATAGYYQTHVITFATAFPTVPFVTLTSSIQEDVLTWAALDITTTGFTLGGSGVGSNSFTGNVNWKAEEK